MTRKEKFGKLVLLEETEAKALLGTDHRAAKLGVNGLEKLVTLLRLRPEICAHSDAARALMDQVKLAAQLQNPNIARIFGIGKVDASYYVTYEFVEGRTLQQILERCRLEGYPFAVDHALLIASKVCAALEYAHSRRTEAGARVFHGLLTPDCVLVSFEGEIRVRGFGYWPSHVRQAGLLRDDEQRYLAPEQASGSGDPRADGFALGAILFETLTGQPPAGGGDPASLLGTARLLSPTSDDDSVPEPIAQILMKALAPDPASRYGEIADLRKAIDTLLFSGDFTPTTFNLAFFMHSLFRDDMEREARALKEERESSYAGYLPEEGVKGAASSRPAPAPLPTNQTEPFDPRLLAAARQEVAAAAVAAEVPDLVGNATVATAASPDPPPVPAPPPHASSPSLSSREAASGFTFHKDDAPRSKTPLLVGIGVVALVAATVGGWYFLQGRTPLPPSLPATTLPVPTTLSPEVVAAQERVKELEQKLATLEAEKQAAEAKAADDAKAKVEAQAKAKGQEVDQAALERAQEEARQQARLDEERRQREELKRVEDQKRAEESRLAEERRRAEEAAAERAAQERAAAEQAALAAQATPPPTTAAPAPPPATEPPLRAGMLVNLDDPGVIGPLLEKKPPLAYPPIALRQRVEGSVDLNVLVDERGNVTDARVVSTGSGRAGLPEAAADYARKWKYRPATKDGVPVKVWKPVTVVFKLP